MADEPVDSAWESKPLREAESAISDAMRARASEFKSQAESMTLQGVRRRLEEDMGLKKGSLDVHRSFIKKYMEELLLSSADENLPVSLENNRPDPTHAINEESSNSQKSIQEKDGAVAVDKQKEISKLHENTSCADEGEDPAGAPSGALSEDVIKEAINQRAQFFRKNIETITLQQVRRMLETDLKLEKNELDAYKGFIGKSLDEVLKTTADDTEAQGTKKTGKKTQDKVGKAESKAITKRHIVEAKSRSDDNDDEKQTPIKKKPRKSAADRSKGTVEKLKSTPAKKLHSKVSRSSDGSNNMSEDNHSSSSAEDKPKRQDKPVQAYGKQVEHLKYIIKSCGLSVPPLVYKRAKQAPESKREDTLIKELVEILEKEGLSSNPSEKEIKAMKRKKERARELEGIDTSNIITSSRRRTTSSFIPPRKPNVVSESDDNSDEEDDDESGNNSGEDDVEGEEANEELSNDD